jgi:hypothetical protein
LNINPGVKSKSFSRGNVAIADFGQETGCRLIPPGSRQAGSAGNQPDFIFF